MKIITEIYLEKRATSINPERLPNYDAIITEEKV